MTTRRSRPRFVRATIVSPSRITSRCAASAASTMRSASTPSSPETLGMSQIACVMATTSATGRAQWSAGAGMPPSLGRADARRAPHVRADPAPSGLGTLGTCPQTRRARPRPPPPGRWTRDDRRRRHGARHVVPGAAARRLPRPGARRGMSPAGLDLGADERRGAVEAVRVVIRLDEAPADTADAYLRLHLLSHLPRAAEHDEPRRVFGTSRTWRGPTRARVPRRLRPAAPGAAARAASTSPGSTSSRACSTTSRPPRAHRRRRARAPRRPPRARHDRHARGLRELQRRHARHLDGRGRISQGVVVGDGSDIGGGASIMGTLSGGGRSASPSASARCSARTRASASRSATTRVVEAASTSRRAPRSRAARRRRASATASSRPSSSPACRTCSSAAIARTAASRCSRARARASC